MRTETLFVSGSGTIISIGEVPLELEGDMTRKRASSIVPVNRFKRFWFMLLRAQFGERGIIAEWTRRWYGPWVCVLFATGESFVHQSRKVCLRWEHQRLEEILSNN